MVIVTISYHHLIIEYHDMDNPNQYDMVILILNSEDKTPFPATTFS